MSAGKKTIGRSKQELYQYFNAMQYHLKISKDSRIRLDKELASSFSVFDYISDRETMLSRILADLLNPEGKHGQGKLFINKFLTMLQKKPESLTGKLTVTLEKPTYHLENFNRRIDIHLSWDNFGIGIENKPWAYEQEDQLKDYEEQLNKEFHGNYILIFLCASGRKPESIANWDQLVMQGKSKTIFFFPDLYNWLLDCRQECEADKIRHFLKDFSFFIEQHLIGNHSLERKRND